MRSRPLYDIVALLARLGLGAVFMAHGWRKIEVGITATGRSFDQLGVPAPTASAVYATFVELLGGAALVAGLGLPVVGVLLFADMAGAFVFVHAGEGLFLVDGGTLRNGYELVLVLGLASLLFAAGAGGRLTVDRWLLRNRPGRGGGADDEGRSFVESLRDPKNEAAPASRTPEKPETPEKPSVPAPRKALPSAPRTPPSPSPPSPPAPSSPPTSPAKASAASGSEARLATEIVAGGDGTEDDVLVAGPRKQPRRKRRLTDTQPMKRDPSGGTGAS